MQAAYTEESMNRQTFNLLGTVKPNTSVQLISNNTNLVSSLLSEGGADTCSFYSGPSDAVIMAFGESAEACGSVAYSDTEACGSVAYSDSEACGSVASSSCGSFSGSACSYSC